MVQSFMAQYTHLSPREVSRLARQYNLTVTSCAPMENGAANTSYLLDATDGRQYILTICDDKLDEEVAIMAAALNHLAEQDVPTTRLVTAADGEQMTAFDGTPVLVKRYIPGEVVFDLPPASLYDLGQALAQLHLVPAPEYLPQAHAYGHNQFHNAYGLGVDPGFEDWLAGQQDTLQAAPLEEIPRSLIHGDIFWDNIICQDGEFQALIDFEDVCDYYSIFDIGSSISGACFETDNTINLDKAAQVLAGYQIVRPLSSAEKSALQLFTVYSVVGVAFWRYIKYNVTNPIASKKYLHREKVQLAEHIQTIPTQVFNQIWG